MQKEVRKAEVQLEYQPYLDFVPVGASDLFKTACENDEVTINSWRDTWKRNVKANSEKFGPFCDRSIGKFFGCAHQKPVIIVGSGPSLKGNAHELKNRGDVTLVSCLHNFHFLEDLGCPADFYVSLDAGDVVIDEVYEGGSKAESEYWEMSKGRKLLCYIGTSPKLLDKWQGEIYFYNCPVPDKDYEEYVDSIEIFNTYVSTGGNVLGACLYIAKAHFGAAIVGFLGADFCFSYDKKFHAWDSKYDAKLGNVLRIRDVWGLPVYTWKSYHNFKGWFESISMSVPGVYYNLSEGGTLGAYNDGNIRSIIQKPLKDFLRQMTMYSEIEEQAKDPKTKVKKLLF